MRAHTLVALGAAALALAAGFFMSQAVRRLGGPAGPDASWAPRLLGGVVRTELASREADVAAVRKGFHSCEEALHALQRSMHSAERARAVAVVDDAYRQWRTALERRLELRERPDAEAELREERVATRERLVESVERATSDQHREAMEEREASFAALRQIRLGAMLAALAAVAAFVAAFLGTRVRAEAAAAPPRAALGALAVEQTTLTVPLNAEQEVAVRLEVRQRR